MSGSRSTTNHAMGRGGYRRAWTGLLLGLLLAPCQVGAQFPMPLSYDRPELPVVREIEVRYEGPKTVNDAVVRANVQTRVGDRISPQKLEQDVRDLVNTGYFFEVQVLQEPVADGVKVIYVIRGKAKIKEILFRGNKFYQEKRLRRDMKTRVGSVLDEHKAHLDAREMKISYQKAGYPDATVTPKTVVDDLTAQAVVTFQVEEGERVFIKQIVFHGAEAFKPGRLHKLMKTRHRWWGSWLAGTGVLKQEQFREDQEVLVDHYRSQGYLDMQILRTETERVAPRYMVIHLHLQEGIQYKIGEIELVGNELYPTSALQEKLQMTSGEVFTPDGFRADIKGLQDYYGGRGYLDTRVRAERVANVETGRIDLKYSLREGELNYIERVLIRGNTKTKDKVIRRELAVLPGDVYNTVRVDRSRQRLMNLGYFSEVDTSPHPTEVENRKDLVITVDEKQTGSMTFGAGFSSVDNFLGFVEIQQGNFDLSNWGNWTGGGQKLRTRIQLGFERQDYLISFTEPWFLDRKLALGVNLFHRESSFLSSDFEERRTGGSLGLEKALAEFVRGQVTYSLQNIRLEVDPTASAELQSQDGKDLRSAIEFGLTYDTRDSVFLTTRGNRTELTATLVGGALGGDVSLYKLTAKTSFYFPFFNKHVLQLVGATGVVQAFGASVDDGGFVTEPSTGSLVKVNDVPIYDRYFLGGPSNLRGFDYRDVSPKDLNNEPIGGNTYAHATAEYTYPIIERVRGAFFFDIGSVWEGSYSYKQDELRSNVGIGVRLNLPIGPLRLDYGYPIKTVEGDSDSGKVQFTVGYQF